MEEEKQGKEVVKDRHFWKLARDLNSEETERLLT